MKKIHTHSLLSICRILLVVVALSMPSAKAASAPPKSQGEAGNLVAGRLFYASYDEGIDADFAIGNPKGESYLPPIFLPGVQGQAIVVGGEPDEKQVTITKENISQKTPGRNVYYEAAGNIDLRGGSMSFWLKPLDWDGSDAGLNTLVHLGHKNNLFLFYKNLSAEQLSFYLEEDNEHGKSMTETVYSIAKWKRGQWHHVVFTWTNQETSLYIDGRLVSTRKIKVPFRGFDAKRLSIGPGGSWERNYMGKSLMDEVEIYKNVFTQEEVTARYRKHAKFSTAFPEFISLGAHTVNVDGKIAPFEYSFEGRGLYDLQGFLSLHEGAHFLSYDDQNFYVATRLPLVDPDQKALPHIKLFLLTASGDRHEINIGQEGGVTLTKNGQKMTTGDAVTTVISSENSELLVEARIPFSALGLEEAPKAGEQWRFNMGLIFPWGEKEVTTAGTLGDMKEEVRYSLIEFNPSAPALRISGFLNADKKQNETRVEVSRVSAGDSVGMTANSDNTLMYGIRNLKHTLFSKDKSTPYEVQQSPFFQNLRDFSLEEMSVTLTKSDGTTTPLYRNSFSYRDKVTPLKVSFLYTLERKRLSLSVEKMAEGLLQVRFVTPEGKEVWRTRSALDLQTRYSEVNFDLDFQKLPPGDYKVFVDHVDPKGKEVEVFSQDYRIPGPDSLALKPYVNPDADTVPAPWTSPILKDQSVEIWGRVYDFSTGVLARQLTSQNHPLLAQPIGLRCNGELLQPEESLSWGEQKQEATVVSLQKTLTYDLFDIHTDIKVFFDGYCQVAMTFKPKESTPIIRSLSLEIPLKSDNAELFRDGKSFLAGGSQAGAVQSRMDVNLTDSPFFWIGNEKAGFNWGARNLKGWHNRNHAQDMEIVQDGEETILRLNFVDSPLRLRDERTIHFSFILTPTRPRDSAYARTRMRRDYGLCAFAWRYFAMPEYENARKEEIDSRAAKVKELYYYLGFMFTSPFHPDWAFFEEEWLDLKPSKAYGDIVGDRIPGVTEFAYTSGSLNSPTFRNWVLNTYAAFVEQNAAKPINPKAKSYYFDTGLALNHSKNKHQEDTSWTDGFGQKFDSLLLEEYREMALNIYRMIKRADPNSHIIYHQGWYRFAPLQHFTDNLLGGEGVEVEVGNRGNYFDLLTPEVFRATFSPDIWGTRMTFLDMTIRMLSQARPEKFARLNIWDEEIAGALKHSYGYCLLHDVDIDDDSRESLPVQNVIWEAQDALGWDARTKFFPYWDKAGPIRRLSPDSPRVMASAYTHEGNLLLIVLNDTPENQTVALELDLDALGVKAGLPGQDVWSPKAAAPPLEKHWKQEFKPRELKMILWKVPQESAAKDPAG